MLLHEKQKKQEFFFSSLSSNKAVLLLQPDEIQNGWLSFIERSRELLDDFHSSAFCVFSMIGGVRSIVVLLEFDDLIVEVVVSSCFVVHLSPGGVEVSILIGCSSSHRKSILRSVVRSSLWWFIGDSLGLTAFFVCLSFSSGVRRLESWCCGDLSPIRDARISIRGVVVLCERGAIVAALWSFFTGPVQCLGSSLLTGPAVDWSGEEGEA
ncbi:hypothetical protein Dimus_025020 [Dionaea muscipula]